MVMHKRTQNKSVKDYHYHECQKGVNINEFSCSFKWDDINCKNCLRKRRD